MNHNLFFQSEILINASEKAVWDALVNPDKVAQYLFGTELKCSWNEGEDISFEGEYQGKSYKDGGILVEFDPPRALEYTYWSAFSGLEDTEENHSLVRYELESSGEGTRLKLSQRGFVSEESLQHSRSNWSAALGEIKKICEENF